MGIVIYPPTLDWDYMKQRPQHLMTHFARNGYTVLYFNKHNESGPVVTKVMENLYVIRHAAFFLDHLYGRIQSVDQTLFWASWSSKIPSARIFGADFTVYDCVDNFPQWEQDERIWINTVDAIVCTASSLEIKMSAIAPNKPIYNIPNGCDWDHFSGCLSFNTELLENLPRKQQFAIGYIGAWAPWVDEQLVQAVAKAYPHLQIVIVGPILAETTFDMPNVHFLGYRPYEQLPSILSYLDVCIIPFRSNQITNSTDPIKLYEYLSGGKKIVSTDLNEVRRWEPYVYIGKDAQDFVRLIDQALHAKNPSPFELSGFSKQFSWEQRFSQIQKLIRQHFHGFKRIPFPPTVDISYQCAEMLLEYCSVNSNYWYMNLADNPGFIGKFQSTEYQCYLKIPDKNPVPDCEAVYLDFDVHLTDSEHGQIHIGLVYEDWGRAHLTFENKPPSIRFATIRTENLLNGTCSLDITPLLKGNRPFPSFQLSADCNLIRVDNPRLTNFQFRT